jgi:hypothetical protein
MSLPSQLQQKSKPRNGPAEIFAPIEAEITRTLRLCPKKASSERKKARQSGLLVLALGYRIQEIEHGGLGKSTRRKLQTIAKTLRRTGRVGSTPSLSLKPGARLVREWHGRAHTVTVTEDAGTPERATHP